LTPLE